jgi:hypothetical protein
MKRLGDTVEPKHIHIEIPAFLQVHHIHRNMVNMGVHFLLGKAVCAGKCHYKRYGKTYFHFSGYVAVKVMKLAF